MTYLDIPIDLELLFEYISGTATGVFVMLCSSEAYFVINKIISLLFVDIAACNGVVPSLELALFGSAPASNRTSAISV